MSVFQKTLKNKTVLIIEPMDTVKTVSIGFWFSVGSRYEKAGLRGISHFVEHLLFKGTKKLSSYDIACGFDYIGSYVNAFTDKEAVCMHCTVPSGKLKYALEFFCDMCQNSIFSDEDLEKERSVIISEIISSNDDPEEAAGEAVAEAVWEDFCLSQSISGSIDDVKKITREQLLNWYKKYFSSGKLTVCIAGNVNIDEVVSVLDSLEDRQEQRLQDGLFDSIFLQPKWKVGYNFVAAPFQQEQLFLLFPIKTIKTIHQLYVYNIFNAIAGDTMSSRLFQRLREQGGFCYNVYSYFNILSDCGYWCAYVSCAKKDIYVVFQQVVEELSKLLMEGIFDYELEGAKQHLCGEEIISSEDTENRSKRLIRHYVNKFNYATTEEILREINSVTKDDVENTIKEIIVKNNMSVVVYGPKLSRQFQKKIKELKL